jgi:hypothetical protein
LTATPTNTPTNTGTQTQTPTPTQTPTNTSTPTQTNTQTPTNTPTKSPTPTSIACYTFKMTNDSAGGSLTAGYTDCDGVSQSVSMAPQEVIYRCSRTTPVRTSGVNSLSTENLGSCVAPGRCKEYDIAKTFGGSVSLTYNDCAGSVINLTITDGAERLICASSYPVRTAGGTFSVNLVGDCVVPTSTPTPTPTPSPTA